MSSGTRTATFLLFFFCIAAHAQYLQPPYVQPMLRGNQPMGTGTVSGTVVGPEGQPLAGVRVDLAARTSVNAVASTYTGQNGNFELYNIPQGTYQLSAFTDHSQTSDVISVDFGNSNVRLRMPQGVAQQYGSGATISVAQMKVPEKARKFYAKSREAFTRNKDEEARKQVEKALQVHPQYAEALTLRGLLRWRAKEGDQGQQDFEQAIQADPHYGVAYFALGSLYNGQARFDDALRTLEQGVSISPNAWQGYFEMAKASIAKGMYSKGLQLATKAEKLGGNSFAAVHLMKAYAMIPMKAYGEAHQELQAFLAREPKGKNAEQARNLLAKVDAAEIATQGNLP